MSSAASGALTELAAIGHQDAYLTINPEVTFFKQLYRRHTNFAISEADVGFSSSIGFNRTMVAVIPRNGDLIGETYLTLQLERLGLADGTVNSDGETVIQDDEAVIHWTNAVGHAAITQVTFEIGGQIIDTLYASFLQIWERYSGKAGKYLTEMIGQFDNVDDMRDFAARDRTLYIPLPFYYCRHHELKVPLIALQYHEVKITVRTAQRADLIVAFAPGVAEDDPDFAIPVENITGGTLLDAVLTINYVYLDTMERRIHAQQPHEFLITQLQMACAETVVAGTTQKNIAVQFNHPVIEVFWYFQENQQKTFPLNRHFNFGIEDPEGGYPWQVGTTPTPLVDPFRDVLLLVNGHERIARRSIIYFRTVQAWERHSSIPTIFAYNYNFGLYPEDDKKPSGSMNMSRIDNVQFCFRMLLDPATGQSAITNDGEIVIFARSYNVKKIAGGMAAVRHAN